MRLGAAARIAPVAQPFLLAVVLLWPAAVGGKVMLAGDIPLAAPPTLGVDQRHVYLHIVTAAPAGGPGPADTTIWLASSQASSVFGRPPRSAARPVA
jgi:hypothetical protein